MDPAAPAPLPLPQHDVLNWSPEGQRRLLELAQKQHNAWQELLEEMRQEQALHFLDNPKEGPGSKLSGIQMSEAPRFLPATEEEVEWTASQMNSGEVEQNRKTNESTISMVFIDSPGGRPSSSSGPLGGAAFIQWLKPRINYIAGTLVVMNTILMFVELEVEGVETAMVLGQSTQGVDWASWKPILRSLDGFFDIAFVLEMSLRIPCDDSGWRFFCQPANFMELLLVMTGVVDFIFVVSSQVGGEEPRFVIMLRAAHALRALRSCRLFKGLRVLLRACESFLSSLCWAMILLCIFISAGSILMGNLLQSFMRSETAPLEDRLQIWEHYGSAYRCCYTLYELTFAGNWPTRARPVTDLVDPGYVVFFFIYITLVSFAVIRVITAVFLKDTLEAAQNDQELQLLSQQKKKAEYVQKLEVVFKTIDDGGKGVIREERLTEVMSDPTVQATLRTLDLDVHEGTALFHLLDNGDGEVTLDEFIDGVLRCKGPARAVDQVAMHAEIRQIDAKIMKVARLLTATNTSRSVSQFGELDVSHHLRAFNRCMTRHNSDTTWSR